MKQVIRKGLKSIVVDEVADPLVTPHHVLVRPFYSLISSGTETADIHTDNILKEVADNPSHLQTVLGVLKQAGPLKTYHEIQAKLNTDYAVLGYSGAGVIAEKHSSVRDLEIGQRVSYGGEGTGHGEAILASRNLVAAVPDGVLFSHACFTTVGSIAMNAVRVAEIQVGDSVAVIGLGLVGQLIAQLVRCQGGVVIAIDVQADRVKLASDTGADHAVVSSDNIAHAVGQQTAGRGVDCAIVAAASKSAAPVRSAVQMCRDRGRLVIVGAMPLDLPRDQMYVKDLRLAMARAYGPGSYDPSYEKQGRDYPFAYVRWTENRNMEEFLRLVSLGRVDVSKLISHEFPLGEAAAAYQTIMDPTKRSLAVILRYPLAEQADAAPAYKPVRRVATNTLPQPVNSNVKIGLLGAGNLAKWEHLPNIKKIPGAELHAVCSANGARGKGYGLRFGASYATSDYAELLGDPAIDAVLIATRHEHHATQIIQALRAGKHVFVEKPLAISYEECLQINQVAKESGKFLTVGFNRRFAPYYLKQKELLAGRTGPGIVTVRQNSPGLVGTFWAADPEFGGAIVGEGVHFVDLMAWMLGSEPLTVSAHSLPVGKRDPIGENNIVASFLFADGSLGNFTYCTVGNKASGGELVETFAQGSSSSSEDFKSLAIKKQNRTNASRWFADKGYLAQMKDFIDCIKAGKHPEIGVLDGIRATYCCLKILEAARTGMPQQLDLENFIHGST